MTDKEFKMIQAFQRRLSSYSNYPEHGLVRALSRPPQAGKGRRRGYQKILSYKANLSFVLPDADIVDLKLKAEEENEIAAKKFTRKFGVEKSF